VRGLLADGWLRPEHSVLVVAGGAADRDALMAAGVRSATITNVDDRMPDEGYPPYGWSRQDAEHLDYADSSFDVCLVHQALHHCRSPHRALGEMYRVARHGIVVFEPHESLMSRLGVRLGVGQRYELAAVAANDVHRGGVQNTDVPNFVYRWTEREVYKTLAAYDPAGSPRVRFRYDLREPGEGAARLRRGPSATLARVAVPVVRAVLRFMPSQANAIAIVADKLGPRDLHPWLVWGSSGPTANAAWFDAHGRAE
jgi:SAM-dependent methyltransferase